MPYPIPQFIEEEAKIIFFLTFRQFFMLCGGGIFCFVLFRLLPLSYFLPTAAVLMTIVAILAFVKINNESAIKIILSFLKYSLNTKNYIWKQK